MFEQIFANPWIDGTPERIRRIARRFSRYRAFARVIDRDTLFYLAGIALVGSITICVFFGLGFYALDHPAGRSLPGSATRHEREVYAEAMRPLLELVNRHQYPAKEEILSSAGEAPADPATGAPPSSEGTTLERAEQQEARHPEPVKFSNASSDAITGTVTEAADAMTWVVAKNTVRLWGIRPALQGLAPPLVSFVERVRAKGPLECHKHANSRRYRCLTPAGEDLAEAALLAGIGRAAEGASPAYRHAEAKARRQGKGHWAKQ
jgi:endonuclease YncB( thermonuclease family)